MPYLEKCYAEYRNFHFFSVTGPDGYGISGFVGVLGEKGTAGDPSPIEGSRGPPGQKGQRGDPG